MSTDFVVESIPRDPTVAERFDSNVARHQMVPLRDDGLYRHLRFTSAPRGGYREYWFDLITWPGNLLITGDMETFAFARTPDMFEFFRQPGGARINPGYWAEKLRAPRPQDVKVYSEDKFRAEVMGDVKAAEEDYPGLTDAAQEYFFGQFSEWNTTYEDGAATALRHFEYWTPEQEALGEAPFMFTDTWEWDLRDYSYQYLWCCHAIVFGIAMYDRHKAVSR